MENKIDLSAFDQPITKEDVKNNTLDLSAFDDSISSSEPLLTEDSLPSDIRDLLVSAGQGAAMGFGDEAIAAIQSLLKEGDLSKYRELQQKYQEEYKELQRRSPTLSTIGELAGGFYVPGIGVAGALGKGATLGQKALAGAKAGAKVGSISAIGGSEEYLKPQELAESAKELGTEALKGATLGAGIGAVSGAIGHGIGKLGDFTKELIEEDAAAKRAIKAFKLEREGTKLTAESGQAKIYKGEIDAANEAAKDILLPYEAAMAKYNEAISKVKNLDLDPTDTDVFYQTPEGVEFSPAKLYNRLLGLVEDIPSLEKIDRNFYEKFVPEKMPDGSFQYRSVNISDLLKLREKLLTKRDLISNRIDPTDFDFIYGQGYNKQTGEMEIPGFIQELDDVILNIIPNAEKLRIDIKNAARIPEQILNKNIDPKAQPIKLFHIGAEEGLNRLQKKLQYDIESAGGSSRAGIKARQELSDLRATLKEVQAEMISKYPELKDSFTDPDKLVNKLLEKSEESAALTSTIGIRQSGEMTPAQLMEAFGPIGLLETGTTNILGKTGRFARFMEPVTKTVEDIGGKLQFPVRSAAENLKKSSSPYMQKLGQQLEDALQNKKGVAVAATLNSLFQNESARKELGMEPGQTLIFTDD